MSDDLAGGARRHGLSEAGTAAAPSRAPRARQAEERLQWRARWLLASLALVALPFLLVAIPPCVDLPQHVAQARLFREALHGGPYAIQWLTPYSLSYLPLLALSAVFPPFLAGKLHLLLLALLVVGALHLVAARRGRPPQAALLASAFVFSYPLYWGFLSFLLGAAVFFGWLLLVARAPRRTDALAFGACALLLDMSHAMWLAVALVWLVLRGPTLRRLAGVVPAVALAAWQATRFVSDRFDMAPLWVDFPLGRATGVVDAALGGLRGPVEPLVLALVAVLVAVGLLGRRARDRELLLAAGLLAIVYAAAPDRYLNTMAFAQRWLPFAAMLLILGAPPAPRLGRVAPALVAAGLVAVTAASWRAHESDELDGLRPALAALPEAPRVLGLNLLRGSALFKPRVGLQTFAWSQALHGGVLNFSFAEHPASLVVWKKPELPWTPGLEWEPERLRPSDFQYFDYALVAAQPPQHDLFAHLPQLEPVTAEGHWRLYRVRR